MYNGHFIDTSVYVELHWHGNYVFGFFARVFGIMPTLNRCIVYFCIYI